MSRFQRNWHPGVDKAVRIIIEYIGDDPKRSGLEDTPERFVRSIKEIYSGYEYDEKDIQNMLTVFEEEQCDSIVLLKDIDVYSTCEHHLLPFFGKAHIAYIPSDNKVVGLSKLARVLEVYSRRLQIQERICRQVVDCLMTNLAPEGAACVLECTHTCLCSRGVNKQGSVMVTSALGGVLFEPEGRQELMSLIFGGRR